MVDIITYYSINAEPNMKWLAQIVLPNGKYWGVYFTGVAEHEVKDKALAFWQAEQAKIKPIDPWAELPTKHHAAGLKWIMHVETREKKRLPADEAEKLVANNDWIYAGPKSK